MNTELWEIDATFLQAMQGATAGTTLTITAQPSERPSQALQVGQAPQVELPAQSLWTPMTAAPAGSLFLGRSDNGPVVGLACGLVKGSPWGGTLTWYVGIEGQSTSPPEYAVTEAGITLTYGTASTYTGFTWYTMTLAPLSWSTTRGAVRGGGPGTALGVALAEQAGTLYLVYANNTDSTVYCSTSTDGVSWADPAKAGANAAGGPALASLNGTLYLVYQQQGSSTVLMCTNAGSGWTSSTVTPISASSAPALGVFSSGSTSVLCMAYLTAGNEPPQMNVRAWSASKSSWSGHSSPGTGARGAPALVDFNGQLLLAQQGATSQTVEIYAASAVSTSGTTWPSSPIAVIRMDASDYTVTSDPSAPPPESLQVLSNPSFCVYGGRLYLAFTDAGQSVWICSSSDGESFSGFAQLSAQVGGVQSNANPALAALGSTTLALATAPANDTLSMLTAT